jgi:beta-glucan synthesis-associated protein KRE6
MNVREPDDYLHNPDPKRDRHYDAGGHIFTARGIANLGCLLILASGILMLLFGSFLISSSEFATDKSAF